MKTPAVLITAAAAAAALAACDNPAGPRPTAVLEATASPSPVTPVVCPESSCGSLANQLEVTSTVTVRETAGVAGTIETVTLLLRRSSDNATIVNAAPSVGTRFAASGSVSVPVAMHWGQNQLTTSATLTVTINARDDNGHTVNTSVAIPVLPFAQASLDR
jgi:hypothetical protein